MSDGLSYRSLNNTMQFEQFHLAYYIFNRNNKDYIYAGFAIKSFRSFMRIEKTLEGLFSWILAYVRLRGRIMKSIA
jgi:hypothetical protein